MHFKGKGRDFFGGGGRDSLIHLNAASVIIFNYRHSQNAKYSLCNTNLKSPNKFQTNFDLTQYLMH